MPTLKFIDDEPPHYPAEYHEQLNQITVFWKHHWFRAQLGYWDGFYGNKPGALSKIEDVLKRVFGVHLHVHVCVCNILRPKAEWSLDSYKAMVAPDTLASLMAVEALTNHTTGTMIRNRLKGVVGVVGG